MEPIFDCDGRPVVKTGEKPMQGKHGPYTMVFVRYIDGRHRPTGKLTRGAFDRLKPIRGNQARVWHRVDHLTRVDRMDPDRALKQATDELVKGVLV